MTLIRRTNPLGERMSLRLVMDRRFEDSLVRPGGGDTVTINAAHGSNQSRDEVKPRQAPITSAPAPSQES